MDFHLDKLLNFPNATVESCSLIDQVSYFKIPWLNEKIQCPIGYQHKAGQKISVRCV